MSIRKAVIPAAGVGSRFLPISKFVPKELIPLFNKPIIQYAIEEAIMGGIEEIIIVTSPSKGALDSYVTQTEWSGLHSQASISLVVQDKPLGLGHAVMTAKELIANEPFAVILPDDIIRNHNQSVISRMIEIYNELGGAVTAVQEIPTEDLVNYGVIEPLSISEDVYRIKHLIEKPDPGQAPSQLAIVGRYVLPENIFDLLEETVEGANGEIQLTDGLVLLLKHSDIFAYKFPGIRYDCGTPIGLLKASLSLTLSEFPDDNREKMELKRFISEHFLHNQ